MDDEITTFSQLAQEIVDEHDRQRQRCIDHQMSGHGIESFEGPTLAEIIVQKLETKTIPERALIRSVAEKLVHGYNEALSGDSEELVMDATDALNLISPIPAGEEPLDFSKFWEEALQRLRGKHD